MYVRKTGSDLKDTAVYFSPKNEKSSPMDYSDQDSIYLPRQQYDLLSVEKRILASAIFFG